MMKVPKHIFREYDIRGVVGEDLTDDFVYNLGRALGTYFLSEGVGKASVGRDMRHSSKGFSKLLIDGINSTGCNTVDLGMVPTPVCYFSNHYYNLNGGVVITGSHNPPEFNGFKIVCGEGAIFGEEILRLRDIIENEDFVSGDGSSEEIYPVNNYIEYILERVDTDINLQVIVDCGSGMASRIAPAILEEMGCRVGQLYCEPDGTFPYHHPDPTLPEALQDLQKSVENLGADLGVAFDGDADRIGAVNEFGEIVYGDRLLAVYARDILEENPGAKIVYEVKCSRALEEEIEKYGGIPLMWKTGHSLIEAKIREEGALLAGEMSGHIYFADDYFGFDDAIYASARLVQLLGRHKETLSEMLDQMPRYYSSPEIREDCPDDIKFKVVDKVGEEFANKYNVVDIDGVRVEFLDGWGLVRASNTQPALVMRFEAETKKRLSEIEKLIKSTVSKKLKELRK
jgi:phosphomannomutase/phosphoglucomutase